MAGYFNKVKKIKELGISILEAVMATAVVGIGFVAIFQMVSYSTQSIDVSGERTKANYLVSMLAEDVIGNRNTLYGVSAKDENIVFNEFGEPTKVSEEGNILTFEKFTEHILNNPLEVNNCANRSDYERKNQIEDIYKADTQSIDAPRNKYRKWKLILETDRQLKCRGGKQVKTLKIYQLCRWDHCDYRNDTVYDNSLYIGRIQINLNQGKKRKFLYFQADYKLKD